ncbi:hypothetical protein CWS72_24105 [Telmatospirillum siberiense]|uniref:Type IV secretion protein DotH n=2 Tax=Telmatospirillum siberiense TaxID=382514 RepID=A0A2N3PNK6_9PROT|nr:hypothetical protein CWS72_24105 [Telmatospirillum siberiense]
MLWPGCAVAQDTGKSPASTDAASPAGNNSNGNAAGRNAAGSPPPALLPMPPDLRGSAYKDVIDESIPLTPQEIREFKKRTNDLQHAAAAPVVPLKPVSGAVSLSFDPGSPPPEIKLGTGRVTSLVFFDRSGEPWPVEAIKPGAAVIEVTKGGDQTHDSNIINVVSTVPQPYTDLSIVLKGAPAPIKIGFAPGTNSYQSSLSVRVNAAGVNAKPPIITTTPADSVAPEEGSQLLMAVLTGVPPDGAQPLTVEGGPAQAWRINDQVYLRTTLPVLSPAWIGSVRTGEMAAYLLDDTPIVLVSADGQVVSLRIGLDPANEMVAKVMASPKKRKDGL